MLLSFLSALLSLCFFVCCIRFDRFRIGVLYVLTSLCLCFPVYAEDEAYTFDSEITEFTYLQNNELKLNQVENNIIQDEIQTQEEITAILSEPLVDPSPVLRSVSGDSSLVSVEFTRTGDNLYYFTSQYLGSEFDTFENRFLQFPDLSGSYNINFGSGSGAFSGTFSLPDSEGLRGVRVRYRNGDTIFNSNLVTVESLTSEPIDPGFVSRGDFFTVITTFLTWILSSFSVLTSWILGDSMAVVYASIFLVGCVVAMLFRVLRSA